MPCRRLSASADGIIVRTLEHDVSQAVPAGTVEALPLQLADLVTGSLVASQQLELVGVQDQIHHGSLRLLRASQTQATTGSPGAAPGGRTMQCKVLPRTLRI